MLYIRYRYLTTSHIISRMILRIDDCIKRLTKSQFYGDLSHYKGVKNALREGVKIKYQREERLPLPHPPATPNPPLPSGKESGIQGSVGTKLAENEFHLELIYECSVLVARTGEGWGGDVLSYSHLLLLPADKAPAGLH